MCSQVDTCTSSQQSSSTTYHFAFPLPGHHSALNPEGTVSSVVFFLLLFFCSTFLLKYSTHKIYLQCFLRTFTTLLLQSEVYSSTFIVSSSTAQMIFMFPSNMPNPSYILDSSNRLLLPHEHASILKQTIQASHQENKRKRKETYHY